jgi:hypothetical protein
VPDQQQLHHDIYTNLTTETRRAMHRADELGYEVTLKLHADPYGVEVTMRPATKRARARLMLKGFEGQMIRATSPFVAEDPSTDMVAIEAAVLKALELHDKWMGLVPV